MALYVVDGPPGAGKSYWLLHFLATNLCVQLKDGRFILDPFKKIRLITNIDGLVLPHEKFSQVLVENGGFANFFTKEYQKKFAGDARVLYFLDEAQEWFRSRSCKLTHENLLFFEWIRHEGVDVFLATQDEGKIDSQVRCLAEKIISAQPRSKNLATELAYKEKTFAGDDLGCYRLVFDKKIAALYKSSDKPEAVKIKNFLARKFFAALAVTLLMLGFFGYRLYNWWDGKRQKYSVAAAPAAPAAPVSPAASFAPAASPAAAASASLPQSSGSSNQVDYYMYRLDHAVHNGKVSFLLGIAWISKSEFPYLVVKRGNAYFAKIPSVLLPALEKSSRALPIRTEKD